jgi:hypothetical protein
MKAAVCGLVASTLALTVAPSREAWAQRSHRVVVEKFSGPGTMRFRTMVLAVLAKKGAVVLPIEKVTTTEADLGLLKVSDNYVAAAKELKATAFFAGTITSRKRKTTAWLQGTGADGKRLGPPAVWTASSPGKVFASMKANLSKKMAVMLAASSAHAVEPGTESEKVAPHKDVDEVLAAAEAETAAPRRASRRKVEQVADEEEPPPLRRRARVVRDDEESISADADLEAASARERQRLDVSLAAHVYRRDFNYNDNLRGGQQAYKLPAVPAPSLSVDYFVLRNFGLTAGGEYALALVSQDSQGNKFSTRALSYFIGAKARIFVAGATELQGGVAYAINSFKIVPGSSDTTVPQVAGVLYEQARIGLTARIPLNDKAAVIGGGNYLHLFSIGQLRKEYFPGAKGRGGEGFAGVAFPLSWMKGLEGRITLDFRRYVFALNPLPMDTRVAGGATDQYIGLNLGAAYRN